MAVTLRAMLDRKRTWLMVGLAAIPVALVALVVTLSEAVVEADDFDRIIVATILPLIALVFGTSALGSELDEGTIVYLLAKPVRRLRVVLAKSLVAALLTATLVVVSTMLTGAFAMLGGQDLADVAIAYAAAAALGGSAYAVVFLAASAFTRWALAIGLVYALLWESVLSGLLPGTANYSIRQATLGVARGLAGEPAGDLSFEQGLVTLVVVILGGVAVATWRLSRYQLRGGD